MWHLAQVEDDAAGADQVWTAAGRHGAPGLPRERKWSSRNMENGQVHLIDLLVLMTGPLKSIRTTATLAMWLMGTAGAAVLALLVNLAVK
ncbi:hypothetical protein ACPCSF_34535 [Streptomyces griseoincarnatus]